MEFIPKRETNKRNRGNMSQGSVVRAYCCLSNSRSVRFGGLCHKKRCGLNASVKCSGIALFPSIELTSIQKLGYIKVEEHYAFSQMLKFI